MTPWSPGWPPGLRPANPSTQEPRDCRTLGCCTLPDGSAGRPLLVLQPDLLQRHEVLCQFAAPFEDCGIGSLRMRTPAGQPPSGPALLCPVPAPFCLFLGCDIGRSLGERVHQLEDSECAGKDEGRGGRDTPELRKGGSQCGQRSWNKEAKALGLAEQPGFPSCPPPFTEILCFLQSPLLWEAVPNPSAVRRNCPSSKPPAGEVPINYSVITAVLPFRILC